MSNYKLIFENSKHLIDKRIYHFLFLLIKDFFYLGPKSHKSDVIKKLEEFIDFINKKYIKDNNFYITRDENYYYTETNFINILKFVKTQNRLFAAEILENILIDIFSLAMKCKKENTFEKYIYNNMQNITINENVLPEWLEKNLLNNKDFNRNLEELLKEDLIKEKDEILNGIQNKIIIYKFLKMLYKEKNNISKYKTNIKLMSYKNKERFTPDTNIFMENNNNSKTTIDNIESNTYYSSIFSAQFHDDDPDKPSNVIIKIFKSFLISVYIYFQNRNSPSDQYIDSETNDIRKIPFAYDLTRAAVDFTRADIIFSPARVDQRIEELLMGTNKLKNMGILELSKVLLFNKSIKVVDFNTTALKSNLIRPLNLILGLFDNYNVEVLNLSHNYLKSDSEHFLSAMLSHLKGLKTINLSSNDLKGGISSFLVLLKQLYREEKIKLENLNLNLCKLDDISFYELGELLKSKYCKLKRVYLNENYIPSSTKFLKKLKKNRSLVEITFNKGNFGNNDADDIMRITSNTNIEDLYLYKNKLSDFDNCLRILSRTKLVHSDNIKGKIDRDDSNLYNLDLSFNEFFGINVEQIKLLEEIIKNTTLCCLDLSGTLLGKNLNRASNLQYRNEVSELKKFLEDKIRQYYEALCEKYKNQIDIKILEKFKTENSFKKFEKKITNIIEDKNAKYTLFLEEKVDKLINEDAEYNSMDFDEKEEIKKKLVNYIKLELHEKNIKENEDKIKESQLILI